MKDEKRPIPTICKSCGGIFLNYSDPGEVPVMVHPDNGCRNGEPMPDNAGISEALHNAWLEGFLAGQANKDTNG